MKRYFNDKKINLSLSLTYEFLQTADIELYNEDANKIIDKYDTKKSFIFLDPPYIASCNNFYSTDTGENIENIYEMLSSKGLKNFKCKIFICHENNEYNKKYQTSIKKTKKNTTHICIKNYKL